MSRPFIPVPNVAQVELVFQISSAIAENIFHVRKSSPYSAADLIALRNLVDNWDSTSYASRRSNTVSLFRIISKALDSLGSPVDDYGLPTPRFGGTAASAVTNNTAFALKKATGLTGRSFRGRLYFVGLPATVVEAGTQTVSAVAANLIVAALNTLITSLAAAGHTLGVVSYMSNGAWRSEGLFTPVTGWVYTDRVLDSQRRRLPGRGI